MRALDVPAGDQRLLPPVCRDCVWWQTAADAETPAGDRADTRTAWEQQVETDGGLFGRVLLDGDLTLGWMQLGPAELQPRARRLPPGHPSPDAYLLMCAYFHDEDFLVGFHWLLQDVVAALKNRGVEALEAYALCEPSEELRFAGYLRALNLFNGSVLEGNGFRCLRKRAGVGRYRLDLASLVDTARHERADHRSTQPAPQPI